jgi:hypothetical protein
MNIIGIVVIILGVYFCIKLGLKDGLIFLLKEALFPRIRCNSRYAYWRAHCSG